MSFLGGDYDVKNNQNFMCISVAVDTSVRDGIMRMAVYGTAEKSTVL